MLYQRQQQQVLARAQLYWDIVLAQQLATREIEAPAVEPRQSFGALLPARQHPAAAKHGTDARDQLSRVEWLGDIVVGAELQADDAIRVLGQRGEQDDRHLRGFLQALADAQSVLAWHHYVQHDEIRIRGREQPVQLAAVRRNTRPEAAQAQVVAQRCTDLPVVVDHDYVSLFV